jgi:hypothetical protein
MRESWVAMRAISAAEAGEGAAPSLMGLSGEEQAASRKGAAAAQTAFLRKLFTGQRYGGAEVWRDGAEV